MPATSLAAHPHATQVEAVGLSERQLECLAWVQEGKSSRDIGAILGISPRVAERHIARACQRLGVRTRLQAVLRARALRLLRPSARL